jgi:hypothetical protein
MMGKGADQRDPMAQSYEGVKMLECHQVGVPTPDENKMLTRKLVSSVISISSLIIVDLLV